MDDGRKVMHSFGPVSMCQGKALSRPIPVMCEGCQQGINQGRYGAGQQANTEKVKTENFIM